MITNRAPDFYESDELEALAVAPRYQEWIAEQFRSYLRGTLLEVGAGIGTMAQKWVEHVEHLHLLEPADNLYPRLMRYFASDNRVTLHHGVLDDIVANDPRLGPDSVDGVIMVNVLEHIEHDDVTLRLIHQLLRPSGHLMIFVPAMPALYGSFDERLGHYRRYTKRGLARVCEQAGFETLHLRYFDVFGTLPWWFVNRVLRSQRVGTTATRIYDRFVVPVGRALERWIPVPIGKNLVYVGRKIGRGR